MKNHSQGGENLRDKSLEEVAYDLLTKNVFLLSIERARKWAPNEVPKISAEDLVELADAARKRETLQLDVNKPLVCEALADPRIIDTAKGPWEVLDIALPDGSEHLLSLGHTVLKKAIANKMPVAGKKLVIMSLGKPQGKRYYNYVVMTLEEWQAAQAKKKTKGGKD